MKPSEYTKLALRTAKESDADTKCRAFGRMDLIHAALGLATETGEFIDATKKHIYYGKPLDRVNLLEELGDLCWYIALAIDFLETSWEEIWTINIKKLQSRYASSFSSAEAIGRDHHKERAEMILASIQDALVDEEE